MKFIETAIAPASGSFKCGLSERTTLKAIEYNRLDKYQDLSERYKIDRHRVYRNTRQTSTHDRHGPGPHQRRRRAPADQNDLRLSNPCYFEHGPVPTDPGRLRGASTAVGAASSVSLSRQNSSVGASSPARGASDAGAAAQVRCSAIDGPSWSRLNYRYRIFRPISHARPRGGGYRRGSETARTIGRGVFGAKTSRINVVRAAPERRRMTENSRRVATRIYVRAGAPLAGVRRGPGVRLHTEAKRSRACVC
ncbi:hypothetical protein EVAR_16643_1 [Eumeta japonica]|uniref:Uncharacterized protein n=1 Tax=Eumeta variegata TaxID=151549 RepID=A0A4C1UZG3_EUMVA|nr:hypothetical protein EVAR_16643_1 [Eumeta japonica]